MGKVVSRPFKENGPASAMQSVIQCSLAWAREAKRLGLRAIELNLLAHAMLDDIPEPARSHWAGMLRTIDTRTRAMYYGHKVNESNNDTTLTNSYRGSSKREVPNG